MAALWGALRIRRVDKAVIHDLEDFADGDFFWCPGEKIATVNAAPAGENAASFEFEENLLEIFYRDAVALGDLVNGDNFRIFQGEMQNSPCCVFAFCRHSHGFSPCRLSYREASVKSGKSFYQDRAGAPTKVMQQPSMEWAGERSVA